MKSIKIIEDFVFVQKDMQLWDYDSIWNQQFGLKIGEKWLWRHSISGLTTSPPIEKQVRYLEMRSTGRWLVSCGMYLIRLADKMEKRNL